MTGEDKPDTAPYESLLKAIVDKIQVQPFLFIIAIATLIVALVIVGAGLGSADFRFAVVIIAVLAAAAMAGHYFLEARKSTAAAAESSSVTRAARRTQKMEAEQGGEITDARQEMEGVTEQSIKAAGPGARLHRVEQISRAPAKPEVAAGRQSGIDSNLYRQLQDLLMRCAPLESDEALRSLFVDARLRPWRNKVPTSSNVQARAENLVDFLHDKSNVLGENALVLFLQVAAERLDPGDACRRQLLAAAEQLRTKL